MAGTYINLNCLKSGLKIKPSGAGLLAGKRPVLQLNLSATILAGAKEGGRALRVKEIHLNLL
jgi:hypothetical protein